MRRRFLVIGCGSIGKRHIRNLQKLGAGEITAFDVRPDRRREAEKSLNVKTASSLEEAWRLKPEAALITAPPRLHLSLAREALKRGCHLFIEKPLSDRLAGLPSFLKEVRRRRRVTLVGCNMRFHPGLEKMKALLDQKAIGAPLSLRAEVGQYLPDWHPFEDYRRGYSARRALGGGVILDAVHELDYLRWMMGEARSAACIAGKLSSLDIGTEDVAAILVRFASGAIGEVHMDYVQRAYSRTCHIIGEKGTLRWDWSAGEVRHYSASSKRWRVFRQPAAWEPNQMYLDEMRHFLRCLDGREAPAADVFDGERTLRLALAAKSSARKARFVNLESHGKKT